MIPRSGQTLLQDVGCQRVGVSCTDCTSIQRGQISSTLTDETDTPYRRFRIAPLWVRYGNSVVTIILQPVVLSVWSPLSNLDLE